jgi:HD-like signal output (HDOD) protein
MPSVPTLDEVCERALRLPCSPTLLPRLVSVLEDVNASSQDIETIIRMDTALAGSTLRLANSAYFSSGGQKVESLSDAVMRLGSREIFRLAAMAMAGRWMAQPVQGFKWEPGDFCRRSLVCAVAAEYLAQQSGKCDPAVAYTAALIHEIGKLAIAYSCAEHMPAVRTKCETESIPWTKAEQAILGYDYAHAGAELLRRWNFPANLIAVAEFQPPVATMPENVIELAVHVHAGQFLSVSLGAGAAEDGFLFDFNSDILVEHGFTADVLDMAFPEVLTRATKLLGEKLLRGAMTF